MSDVLQAGPDTVRAWPLYRAMVGVGLGCGLLIAGVFAITRPVIERNRAAALERAILEVIPGAVRSRSFQRTADGHFAPLREGGGGDVVHAAYAEDGDLLGLAVEARGMGYQDEIALIYGYAFDRDAIVGMRVLASRETPGLGDKIETDPAFLSNFDALDVSLDESSAKLRHPITAVKKGEKESPWEVDAITGATISSVAIAEILQRSSAEWIPTLHARLADFRSGD